MRHIAGINDAVAVKEFMFVNIDGHQIVVNNTILDGPKFNSHAVVLITKAWEDYETGWRYHARPVNTELVDFLKANNAQMSLKVYVGEFDIDWTVNATAIIEQELSKSHDNHR